MCDGYELRASIETINEAAQAQLIPVHRTSVVVNPKLGILGTHEEGGLFEKFYYISGRKIFAVLNSKLVYQFVLQTYHSDKAVRSIVIAITALVTGHQAEGGNALLTLPPSEFTLRQYHKGLQWLRKSIVDGPGRPTELTLISCLLLTIFEFIRCHWTNSYMHCHSGLKILRRETIPSRGLSPLKEAIHRAFSGVDRRAALWYYVPGKLYQRPQIWRRCWHIPPTGNAQSSLSEAARSWSASMYQKWDSIFDDASSGRPILQMNEKLEIKRDAAAIQLDILQMNEKLEIKRDAAAIQLDDLTELMDAYVARRRNNVSREIIHQSAALTINEIIALLMLDLASPTPEPPEAKLRKQMFFLILKLAESVIRTGRVDPIVATLLSKLSNTVGGDSLVPSAIIFPLYFAAVECQDLELRQTAIALLSLKSWREGGPWGSATVARKIEEESKL